MAQNMNQICPTVSNKIYKDRRVTVLDQKNRYIDQFYEALLSSPNIIGVPIIILLL